MGVEQINIELQVIGHDIRMENMLANISDLHDLMMYNNFIAENFGNYDE